MGSWMAELRHGAIVVILPDFLTLPEKAGKLSKKEVRRLVKVPKGADYAAKMSASALEKMGESFQTPRGLTPEVLLRATQQSYALVRLLDDLSVVQLVLQQALLLADAELYKWLQKLNDSLKAQGKYSADLYIWLSSLVEYFGRSAQTRKKRQRKNAAQEEEAQKEEPKVAELTLVGKEDSREVS